eukprot:19988-Heterococcus_DN1.PRE.3
MSLASSDSSNLPPSSSHNPGDLTTAKCQVLRLAQVSRLTQSVTPSAYLARSRVCSLHANTRQVLSFNTNAMHSLPHGSMAYCGGGSSSSSLQLTPNCCAPPEGALAVAKRTRSFDSSASAEARGLSRQRDASPSEDSCDEQGDENAGVTSEQPAPAAAAAAESAADREARELAESEALARQFMEEEAMASYEIGLEAMRAAQAAGGVEGVSDADMAAMRAAMEEHDEEGGEGIDGDSGTLDYDALIELGEAIGDVKQDRWKLRARTVIAQLPSFVYGSSANATAAAAAAAVSASNCSASSSTVQRSVMITDVKCLVCMTEYESSTVVRELPCGHIYCAECIDGYLAAHTCACPLCKRSVDVASTTSSSSSGSSSAAAASAGRLR